jgi:hypothetical protein
LAVELIVDATLPGSRVAEWPKSRCHRIHLKSTPWAPDGWDVCDIWLCWPTFRCQVESINWILLYISVCQAGCELKWLLAQGVGFGKTESDRIESDDPMKGPIAAPPPPSRATGKPPPTTYDPAIC